MFAPGAQIGRFRVEEVLGKGSFGVVLKAYDALLKEHVALKALHANLTQDAVAVERLRREVLAARRVDHPNVCRIHDLQSHETSDGTILFIVMEWVEGEPLDVLLDRGALPIDKAVTVMRDVSSALAAAHKVGVLHRDIKPGNVIVRADGTAMLVDFGIAAVEGLERLTQPGFAIGTFGYLAPERWQGMPATEQSDVFAAGVLLFAAITRRFPWMAPAKQRGASGSSSPSLGNMQMLELVRTVPPTPPSAIVPDVDAALDRVVVSAVAADPALRTPNAQQLSDQLSAWLQERTVPKESLPKKSLLDQPTGDHQVDTRVDATISVDVAEPISDVHTDPTALHAHTLMTRRVIDESTTLSGRTIDPDTAKALKRLRNVIGVTAGAVVLLIPVMLMLPKSPPSEPARAPTVPTGAKPTEGPSTRTVEADLDSNAAIGPVAPVADNAVAPNAQSVEHSPTASTTRARPSTRNPPAVVRKADRESVERKLKKLEERAAGRSSPALDRLASQIAADIAAERYESADQRLDRALALVRR